MIKNYSGSPESFNKLAPHPLQTWEWGEFRKSVGNRIIRLGIYKGKGLKEIIQITFSKIPLTNLTVGTFIRGGIPKKTILRKLREVAKEENAIFIKLEPNIPTSIEDLKGRKINIANFLPSQRFPPERKLKSLLIQNKCVPGKTLFTPKSFWIDLRKDESKLFSEFHPKTRYNIRLAIKYGVKVEEDNSERAFERYIDLTRETVARQKFFAHSEEYHRKMWKYLHQIPVSQNKQPIARLFLAKYGGEVVSTWILFVWKDSLYYPFGASTERHKKVMANNLMMWEAIKFGKRLGLKIFDLWGKEEGKGFTRFKEGYNPFVVSYIGTWDLITSQLYWPYRIAEFLRWQMLRTRSKFIKPSF